MSIIHIGIYALVGIILYRKKKELMTGTFFHFEGISFSCFLFLLAESVLLIVIASFVNNCSLLFFDNKVAAALKEAAGHLPASIVILCAYPALWEEFLFRSVILGGIKGTGKGIVISSVLFAMWHLNPNQMSYAFVMGLLLSAMAVRTGNLICTVIVHFLFNFYNLAFAAALQTGAGESFHSLAKILTGFLLPSLRGPDGTFLFANFLYGLVIAVSAVILYLYILRRGWGAKE